MEKVISIEEILSDLENGLSRTKSSANYDERCGCIAEKYDLTGKEVNELFKHPELKGKKTKKQPSILIVSTKQEKEEVLNRGNSPTTTNTNIDNLVEKEEKKEILILDSDNVETSENNVVDNSNKTADKEEEVLQDDELNELF